MRQTFVILPILQCLLLAFDPSTQSGSVFSLTKCNMTLGMCVTLLTPYKVFSQNYAADLCEANNLTLWMPKTPALLDFGHQLISEGGDNAKPVWIGLVKNTSDFEWMDDTPLDLTPWYGSTHNGGPQGLGTATPSCVAYELTGVWFGEDCSQTYQFLCQQTLETDQHSVSDLSTSSTTYTSEYQSPFVTEVSTATDKITSDSATSYNSEILSTVTTSADIELTTASSTSSAESDPDNDTASFVTEKSTSSETIMAITEKWTTGDVTTSVGEEIASDDSSTVSAATMMVDTSIEMESTTLSVTTELTKATTVSILNTTNDSRGCCTECLYSYNISETVDMEEWYEAVVKRLLLPKKSVSKYHRSMYSATDNRISAKFAGYCAIFVLLMFALTVVLLDLSRWMLSPCHRRKMHKLSA